MGVDHELACGIFDFRQAPAAVWCGLKPASVARRASIRGRQSGFIVGYWVGIGTGTGIGIRLATGIGSRCLASSTPLEGGGQGLARLLKRAGSSALAQARRLKRAGN
jgi:hypothetical protein